VALPVRYAAQASTMGEAVGATFVYECRMGTPPSSRSNNEAQHFPSSAVVNLDAR
jgi:hypothetical protein